MATRLGPNVDANLMPFASTSASGPAPVLFARAKPARVNGVEAAAANSARELVAGAQALPLEPFHTTKPDGLGLGLAISRSIIATHKGQIWASHRAGGGAEFHFTLPVATH